MGIFDRITKAIYKKLSLNEGNVDELYSEEGLQNLSNLIKSQAGVIQLVEWNFATTKWYKVYSNGWCEQGGTWGSTATEWTSQSVEFPKQFESNNYQLIVQSNYVPQDGVTLPEGLSTCRITEKSTTGFTAQYINNTYPSTGWQGVPNYWLAFGFMRST